METELLSFESVKNWFESVEQRGRKQELTPKAKSVRLGVMKDYLYFNEVCGEPLNPDELLAKALEDRKDAIERLTNYFNWMQGKLEGVEPRKRKLKRNGAITLQAYIRGFYTHNNVIFGKKEFPTPKRIVSEVTKADAKVLVYDYDEEKDELIFRNELIQQLLSNLSLRDQTIVLGLLSTGADAADLFSLPIGFVRGQWEEKRFFWHSNRIKDLEEFKTFFSREATEYLKRYVKQERKDAKDDEPLFVLTRDPYFFKRHGKTIEVGGEMNAHMLAINLRRAAEKMGYNEKTNPFRPKRFRHLFRTACGMAHIDPGFTMAMMGHASDISAEYLEKPRALFLREYVKAESYLTVSGIQKEGFSELVGEFQEYKDKVEGLEREKAELTDKTVELYGKVEELRKDKERLTAKVKAMEAKFKVSADDIIAEANDEYHGPGGGISGPHITSLADLSEDEIDKFFQRALRRKMLEKSGTRMRGKKLEDIL